MMLLESCVSMTQVPRTASAGAESKADKRSHLQMHVATVAALLGQPGHAALAAHEVETDTLSVADFLLHNCHIVKSSPSVNFSVDTSDAKSKADKRSHLQMHVATAVALLGQPGHATLVAREVETDTISVADSPLRYWQNSHPSPLVVTATRKPAADKRSHLQMHVATAAAPLGQPRHAALAAREVETDTLSVADFPCSKCCIMKSSPSINFSVDTSDAESKADKRSHLQTHVATAAALLGQPGHATLAACEVETDTISVADSPLRYWQNSHSSPLVVTATRKPAADKRSHLQTNVATAAAPLGQPGHAALAPREVETDTLSVADFPCSKCCIMKSSPSINFSVDTSDAESKADKRSHL